MKKINKFLLCTLILFLHNCEKIQNMNGKYEWLILTVADYGYVMEIVDGDFLSVNNESIASVPGNQVLQYQWWNGESGLMITGEQYKELPARMKIKWFSYAEDKFYEGDFKLDYEKISNLFKQGLKCSNGRTNYHYFKVAIAPGGQVFLYLMGGNAILLGSYQAEENYLLKWTDLGNRSNDQRKNAVQHYQLKSPLQTQKEIAENRINTTIWKDINIKYPWKYTLEAEEFENLAFTMLKERKGVDYINGEQTWCTDTDYFIKTSHKAIPLEIDGVFKTAAGRTFTIRIYPGNVEGLEPNKQSYEVRRGREQKLVKLFKEFYEKIDRQDFDIHLRMDPHFQTGKVYLKKGNIEQEIPDTEVQIFDDTFGE